MTDVLGYRAKFGVLGPSTNTTVQPEMEAMRPAGERALRAAPRAAQEDIRNLTEALTD